MGLVVADLANPFYTQIAAGVVDAARAAGYEVFIAHASDADGSVEPLVQTMVDRGVDAVLLTVLRSDSGEAIRALRKSRTPWVQISRRMAAVPADFVGIDDASAAAAMMHHVLDHGYSSIATIVGPRASSASASREDAFLEVAHRRGVSLVEHLSVPVTEEGGRVAVNRLLSRGPLPRALVCGSDAIALGVLSELANRGIAVPAEVAVTGFDGLPEALSPLIPLTTVIQPRRRMGERAVELVLDRVRGSGGAIESVILDYELRICGSCGCPSDSVGAT
jgi:LacI family transcriptional regulator